MKHSFCLFSRLSLLASLFFLGSCATSGWSATPDIAYTERAQQLTFPSPSGPKQSAQDSESDSQEQILQLTRNGFRFSTPDASWGLVSDPTDESAPLEFFQTSTGIRAVLSTIESESDQGSLSDRAEIEMQSHKTAGGKIRYSELSPLQIAELEGMGWQLATQQDSTLHQSMGLVAQKGNQVFWLSLSHSESSLDRGAFAKIWRHFFQGLQVDPSLLQSEGPSVGAETIQQHNSPALGYHWNTTDTLWHSWLGVAGSNSDPDLLLTNTQEDISLFIYGAILDPNEVGAQDLFQVFLVRMGLPPQPQGIVVQKKGNAQKFVQDFELTHVVGGYDFKYKGRYFWDNGRGILVVTWTQGVLYNKYQKIMDRAINGVELRAGWARIFDPKLQQFNARVVNQVGLLRLAEDQPIIALSYFEKANRMDSNEPIYLIN